MRKKLHLFSLLLILSISFFAHSFTCQAQVAYENPETGYQVVLEDDAGLLTSSELSALAETMKPITEYGNVGFKTIDTNYSSTKTFVSNYYRNIFGNKSGTIFIIDMDNREIYIYSDGAIYRTVTNSYALTITDNVYRYASNTDYFSCANEAFDQINTLLEGDRIMQPMKYISNALLAVILALLLNFCWISYFSRQKQIKEDELIKKLQHRFACTEPVATYTHQTKRYSPQSSDSGGGSSGGGGGGGHSSGGGSSSGGGGGHRF